MKKQLHDEQLQEEQDEQLEHDDVLEQEEQDEQLEHELLDEVQDVLHDELLDDEQEQDVTLADDCTTFIAFDSSIADFICENNVLTSDALISVDVVV